MKMTDDYLFGRMLRAFRERISYENRKLGGKIFAETFLYYKLGTKFSQQNFSEWETKPEFVPSPVIFCAILELLTFHGAFLDWSEIATFIQAYAEVPKNPYAGRTQVPFKPETFAHWQQVRQTIFKHLPTHIITDPKHLIGIEANITDMQGYLPKTMALGIEGLGGLGKTTLAASAARALGAMGIYEGIYFVGVRQSRLDENGQTKQDIPQIKQVHEALTSLGAQMGLKFDAKATTDEKFDIIAHHYRTRRVIVILDNLEFIEDVTEFMPFINMLLANTDTKSRLIITSRTKLDTFRPRLKQIYPQELTACGVYDFLKLHDCIVTTTEADSLHGLIGGNPLALRLFSTLINNFGMPKILSQLEAVKRDHPDLRLKLFDYVYDRILQLLDDPTYDIFIRLCSQYRMDIGAPIWLIEEGLSHHTPQQIAESLNTLMAVHLVNRDQAQQHYTMHRLTMYYIHKQFFPTTEDG
jgi:hypothetical protein